MYLMMYFWLSTFGYLSNAIFAHDLDFKILTRYDENDYFEEERDIIEGFRTSFVPEKWERNAVPPKCDALCDITAADLVNADQTDETEQLKELDTVLITTTETVQCSVNDYDYEDAHENKDYLQEISTAQTTKKDYFISGNLERGEKTCESTKTKLAVTSVESKQSVTNVQTAITTLIDYATPQEDTYFKNVGSTLDDTCENVAFEGTTQEICRQDDEKKIIDLVPFREGSEENAKAILSVQVPNADSEMAKIGTSTTTDNFSFSSCALEQVGLDKPAMSSFPERQFARKRIGRKRRQKQYAKKRQRILNEEIIDGPAHFRNYSNIPYSDQFVHKSNINIFEVPTEPHEGTFKQTMSIKSRLRENFWLQNEEETSVREIQAGNMKKYMDFDVNPCDNFYEYACGNWFKYNPIPEDRINYDTFSFLRDSLSYILKELLEDKQIENAVNAGEKVWKGLHPVYGAKNRRNFLRDDADEKFYLHSSDRQILNRSPASLNYNENTVDAVTKAKYLYSSCMNTELIEKRGIQPALDLLSELGGWPLLDQNWKPSSYGFEWLLAQLRLYNNDILISEWVGPDIRNSVENIIHVGQTTLGLPNRAYYVKPGNPTILAAYRKYIMAIGLGMGANKSTIAQDALDIVSFEMKLASITDVSFSHRDVSKIYIPLTVRDLHQLIPQLNWLRYFRLVSNNYVEADNVVIISNVPYFRRLVKLISQTNIRTTTNYLLWRFMRHRIHNLDNRFKGAIRRFNKILHGRDQEPPRWRTCIMQVNANLGMALGKLFVDKYYPKQSKNDTLVMIKYIRQAFSNILKKTSWLDSFTTHLALIKLEAMHLKIGYPNYILNQRQLNKRYSDMQLHPAYYFENIICALQHSTRFEHFKVNRQNAKMAWNSPPTIVNAYYSRNKNEMMFPAGILQPPFYHRHFPKAMNFGGIGIIMGHEMTHGFDDKGRLFDKDGCFNNWWKAESDEEFHGRIYCLIQQYRRYVIPELNVQLDGVSTLGENIADNGGLKQAFLAYQYWLNENEDKVRFESLPGLNVTNLQLFFLSFAQIWCGNIRPGAAATDMQHAVHSPGRFRVIGTVSNSEEFAAAFNCKIPAPMNPDEKCTVW